MICSRDSILLRTKLFFSHKTFPNLCLINTFPKKVHLWISHFIHSHKIFDNQLDHNSLQINVETSILTINEKIWNIYLFESTDFSRLNLIIESIDIVFGCDKGGQWVVNLLLISLPTCRVKVSWCYRVVFYRSR